MEDTAARRNFNRQQDDYPRAAAADLMPVGAASLYLAKLDGTPIAASLVYDSADTRTYAHAAMDQEHRRLSAGYRRLRLRLDAREKGLTWFDLLRGTAPEGPASTSGTASRSFKKSFRGEPASHAGTWDLPVSRAGYAAYNGGRAAREGLVAARWKPRSAAHPRSGVVTRTALVTGATGGMAGRSPGRCTSGAGRWC
ncbi:GNAT family N-acetyltransferase [Kocuria rhizophila]|nr:GNAT family N-acetyltransferase [Kocuria rhizophila]